jgi:hypothetical protein
MIMLSIGLSIVISSLIMFPAGVALVSTFRKRDVSRKHYAQT